MKTDREAAVGVGPTSEADLIKRIENLRKNQTRLEDLQAKAIVDGEDERVINGLGHSANQALFKRRKFQKQLNDLRGRTGS